VYVCGGGSESAVPVTQLPLSLSIPQPPLSCHHQAAATVNVKLNGTLVSTESTEVANVPATADCLPPGWTPLQKGQARCSLPKFEQKVALEAGIGSHDC
jgi:hypothetical protein